MTDDRTNQYRNQFFREISEILEKVYEDILKIEANPDNADALNSLFRSIHTIKGSAGVFGLNNISAFMHNVEFLLNRIRSKELEVTPELVDVLLTSSDLIEKMVVQGKDGKSIEAEEEQVKHVINLLTNFGSPNNNPDQKNPLSDKKTDTPLLLSEIKLAEHIIRQLQNAVEQGCSLYHLRLNYTSEHLKHGYDPLVLLKNLKQNACVYYVADSSGNGADGIPNLENFQHETLYLKPEIYLASQLSRDELLELTFEESLIEITEIAGTAAGTRAFCLAEGVDPESLPEFLAGTIEMLETAEAAALKYERSGSREAINELFRVVHNIKGDADFMGLKYLTRFTHDLETLLDKIRSGQAVNQEHAEIIFKSIDYLWRSINALSQGREVLVFPPVFDELQQYAGSTRQVPKPVQAEPQETAVRQICVEQLIQYHSIFNYYLKSNEPEINGKTILMRAATGIINAAEFAGLTELAALSKQAVKSLSSDNEYFDVELLENLKRKLAGYVPNQPQNVVSERLKIGAILMRHGKITSQELAGGLEKQKPIGEILIEQGVVSPQDLQTALQLQESLTNGCRTDVQEQTGTETEIRTMRVDERKIEQLTNLTGEMMVARNTYEHLLNRLKKTAAADRDLWRAFKENLSMISRLAGDFHYGVISLRMTPIGGVFRKFQRIVRDFNRKQRKEIDLVIEGEEVEIDKKAADMLFDPLVHLVRNACDHGIETPAERLRAGKPEKGRLLLKAYQEGGRLHILIQDDGRGINTEKLQEKALNMGIEIPEQDTASILNMVFIPGLSTRTQATDISGRGVGMDVVSQTVKYLGGKILIDSTPNQGVAIYISIPMTMGIDNVLLVRCQQQTYAVPLSSIMETLKIKSADIKFGAGIMLYHYRGEVIMLASLKTILLGNTGLSMPQSIKHQSIELPLIVFKTDRGKVGIIVDQLYKNMVIAVKPLPKYLYGFDIAAGVSIMGDGKIILVLNPEKLISILLDIQTAYNSGS